MEESVDEGLKIPKSGTFFAISPQPGPVRPKGQRHTIQRIERTTPSDPADRIGESTLLNDVLTVEEGVCGWRFKNYDIWDVFNYCVRIDRDMDKWMAPFDSGHQIRLEIIFIGILTALGSCCSHGDGCGNILGGLF